MLIDTGYLLGLLDPRDALHPRCLAWSKHVQTPLLLHGHVVAECLNHLAGSPLIRPAHQLIDMLRGSPAVRFEFVGNDLHDAACRLQLERSDKRWSLTDCVSFELMRRERVFRALSHDRHFEQAGFEALLRRDP